MTSETARPDIERLSRFRPWFYAAAAYNLVWGAANVLFPKLAFDLIGIDRPNFLPLWQVVGMFVLVYAPAYWWAGRFPSRYPQLIVVGMLGKLLGPIGFVWSASMGDLPWRFGLINLTNDLIWWPSFITYLVVAAKACGGWRAMLVGDTPQER